MVAEALRKSSTFLSLRNISKRFFLAQFSSDNKGCWKIMLTVTWRSFFVHPINQFNITPMSHGLHTLSTLFLLSFDCSFLLLALLLLTLFSDISSQKTQHLHLSPIIPNPSSAALIFIYQVHSRPLQWFYFLVCSRLSSLLTCIWWEPDQKTPRSTNNSSSFLVLSSVLATSLHSSSVLISVISTLLLHLWATGF